MAKKVKPPAAEEPLPTILPDDTENARIIKSIRLIEGLMAGALEVDVGVTPDELHDLMEMYITLMYLKRVNIEYWIDHIRLPLRGIALAKGIEAEHGLLNMPLSPGARQTLEGSIDISLKEIAEVRERMMAKIEELKEIPLPGVRIN